MSWTTASSKSGPARVRDRVARTLVQASKAAVPRAVFVQCDTFRAITAGREARSARLFVGSIDGSSRNRSSEPSSWHRPKEPSLALQACIPIGPKPESKLNCSS